jgi:predicted nucleic acid-binding protein
VSSYVLDSSFCGAFIMPDEESQKVTHFFESLTEDGVIYVPHLFWFEISNLLTTAIKRKRISPADVNSLLELLPQSKFNTDHSFGGDYSKSVTALAVKYRLSSYDASYLELAIRKNAALGTLDGNLSKAGAEAGLGYYRQE